MTPASADDLAAVGAQLGRPARSVVEVAHRCPCGQPDVVATAPRLQDGTPFPTTFYLTCPRAASAVGSCESTGLMRRMADRLAADHDLAAGYRAAHVDYLSRRSAVARAAGLDQVPEIDGISAGRRPCGRRGDRARGSPRDLAQPQSHPQSLVARPRHRLTKQS